MGTAEEQTKYDLREDEPRATLLLRSAHHVP